MNSLFFVQKLKSLAPSKEDLLKHKVPDNFIDNFIESYSAIKKEKVQINIVSNDSLLLLLQLFDFSNVEIGIVRFASVIVEVENYYYIGNIEQDILAIDKRFLNVVVLDYFSQNHTIWNCASSSDNFLEALLLCAEFFTSKIVDFSISENNAHILDCVNACTNKAGGDKYKEFYKMLLGYFN